MKRLNIILTTLLAGLAVVSCSLSEQQTGSPRAIKFSASVGTFEVKAGDNGFENGDVIGLYAFEPVNAYDVKLTCNGSALIPEREVYWAPGQSEPSHFEAFYPYRPDFTPTRSSRFTVHSNQSDHYYYTQSDLMFASGYFGPDTEDVHLEFFHGLSRLIITVDNQTDEVINSVGLSPVYLTATIDRLNPESAKYIATDFDGMVGSIDACPVTLADGTQAWSLILPPQTVNEPQIYISTNSGELFEFKSLSPVRFYLSRSNTATVTLTELGATVSFSSEIHDWNEGDIVSFNNKWEKEQALLYVYDESFNQNKSLSLEYANSADWAYHFVSLQYSSTELFGDYEYLVYDISDYIGNYAWFAFDCNGLDVTYYGGIMIEPGDKRFIYRAPAGWTTIFDPENWYYNISFVQYYTPITVSQFISMPASGWQVYNLEGYFSENNGSILFTDDSGMSVMALNGFSDIQVPFDSKVKVWAFRDVVQTPTGEQPLMLIQEWEEIQGDHWSIIGEIEGTLWDTDFPMEEIPVITEAGEAIMYYGTVSYSGGEQFKIRLNDSWDINRGGPRETDPHLLYPEEEGIAQTDAVQNGSNLVFFSEAYKDFCGAITVFYVPALEVIGAADAEAFSVILEEIGNIKILDLIASCESQD